MRWLSASNLLSKHGRRDRFQSHPIAHPPWANPTRAPLGGVGRRRSYSICGHCTRFCPDGKRLFRALPETAWKSTRTLSVDPSNRRSIIMTNQLLS